MNYNKEGLRELLNETVKCCKFAPISFILKKMIDWLPAKVSKFQWIKHPDNLDSENPEKNDIAIFIHPETKNLCSSVYKGGPLEDLDNFHIFNEVENIPNY